MDKGQKYHRQARYWNVNYCAVTIVASVTHEIDWAVYIGGVFGATLEAEAIAWTLKHGAKMTEEDARYFFPEFKDFTYRR